MCLKTLAALLMMVTAPEQTSMTITSASQCPAADDVSRRASLLGAKMQPTLASIDIAIVGEEMRLRFIPLPQALGSDGVERILPLSVHCSERASVASLAIASWLGQTKTQELSLLSLPVASPTRTSLPTKPPASAWQMGLGGMLNSADSWGGGLRIEVIRALTKKRLSWGLASTAGVPRDANVGVGLSRWTRAALLFGPRWSMNAGVALISCDATAAITGLWATGERYENSRSDFALRPGGSGGVRLGWIHAPSWWFDTRFVYSGSSSIQAWSEGATQRRDLARWDFQMTIGASVNLL